ncbi:MAG: OmpP1/FadL family transporter [Sulfurovum sp.]|nr:OmpP1/FadL family transporter [Sulfurovum sp.]
MTPIQKIITVSALTSGILVAGGYKIPEQSLNSMALGAAYVAHTTDADTAYFNPANMSFLDSGLSYIESGITLAHLPENTFAGVQYLSGIGGVPASGNSETENLPIPYFHYVAPAIGKWRYGVSMVAPAGLTKRWESPVQKTFAEEFTLQNVELNPVVSYKVNEKFSVGGGLRLVYSMGKVYSDGSDLGVPYKREMEGDTLALGYNLALAWRPTSDIAVGVTYRSNIDLDEEGEANLYLGKVGQQYSASVSVPIPAALNIGVSKTWDDRVTVEFVYERTFWSSYENLDFEYASAIQPGLVGSFDDPKAKDWVDTNTYRLGVTYILNDRLTLMGGYAYDETPVPVKTLSYELPDSDAQIFSGGFKYQQTNEISWGMAILYDKKESRTLALGENENGIVGKFTDGGAILATVGLSYRF